MAGQSDFFDTNVQFRWLSAAGDPLERLAAVVDFELFLPELDAALGRSARAKGGQIVDATIVEARRPRLTQTEKDAVKGGGVPEGWKPALTRQIDREGFEPGREAISRSCGSNEGRRRPGGRRWTRKRGRKKPVPPGGSARASAEITVPMFGYKNHVGIDREHGFARRFKVTHAFGAALEPMAGWPLTP